MGIFFRRNQKLSNKNNNITIKTNTDILYNIGNDIGEIKILTSNLKNELHDINTRLTALENKVYEAKNKKSN